MEKKSRLYKFLVKVLIAIPIIFVALLFWNFIGGAICNDMKAAKIKKEYMSMELPDKTELVETVTFVGNSSGTGNHTEIWVGMLIRTEQTEENLQQFFREYEVFQVTNSEDGEPIRPVNFVRFRTLDSEVPENTYYIISNYYDAFTQQDLRGH